MIGLVLVCHSARLAQGAAELAAQMGGEHVRIGTAGGLEEPADVLGTDAARVARVIEEVWSDDGVLVLMDTGSAILSAEMALDLLPAERRARVLLSEAPLVEGAVAAAVAAGLGEPLERVAAEARDGLAAKAAHLAGPTRRPAAGGGPPDAGRPAPAAGPSVRLVVENRLGLHARPAALLVRTAAAYDADVTVANDSAGRGPVSARSLNAVATLGVRHGDQILLRASGREAERALAAMQRLADENFGDPAAPSEASAPDAAAEPAASAVRSGEGRAEEDVPRPASGSVLQGLPGSPGFVVGAARTMRAPPLEANPEPAESPEVEWAALERALAGTGADIRRARDSVAGRATGYDAAIFEAHLLFLEDEALLGPAHDLIFERGASAARAWSDAVAGAAAAWEALDEPYLRARVTDLRSVGDQVLRRLAGRPPQLAPSGAGILVTSDLTPAEAASLDRTRVFGVACAFGGPTSHGAILARSLGIPAVVGVGPALLAVEEGTTLTLDGESGTIGVDPPPAAVRAAEDRQARWTRDEAAARELASAPAVSSDGRTVTVAANVAGPHEVGAALAAGADAVGLLRTEFLFLEADSLPGEDEQERTYRAVAESLGHRPLTIRTLDVGADKLLPYLSLSREQNPFLGLRGIRLALRHPELLEGQLRAVLRVAVDHPVRLMFPMVTTVDEVRRASEALDEARASLVSAGVAVPERIEVGIMVEVPAAALTVEAFMSHVDFFSLGTNDLAQYVLAADRGNAEVAALADALHPAVLRLIDETCRAATTAARPVGVCGELAGDPVAIPLLLGLGVTELSMAPARIPVAKQAVRDTDVAAARRLAQEALTASSAAAVRNLGRR